MLAVTDRCNGGCRYCKIPARRQREMTTADIIRLIDEMQAAGTVRLGLWGGEPLIRDDIGALVTHAKRRGLYVTLDSNGLLWQERRGELRELDHLMISLDGGREGHEANRGRGTFDPVMAALENAAATPGLRVWTLTVLTRNNLRDVDFILETAKRLNIWAAFQVLHHNSVFGRNHEELIPPNEDYREALELLLRRKREGARISASSRSLTYLLHWGDYRIATRPAPHLGLDCKAGRLYCNIDTDGAVFACSLLAGLAPAQNALEVGFRKAFDAIPPLPCQACTATCFAEYNYMFGLDPRCILDWIKTTRA
jgi:MoaA/NifB/PqqE/SkfB family radical SAM enzyme